MGRPKSDLTKEEIRLYRNAKARLKRTEMKANKIGKINDDQLQIVGMKKLQNQKKDQLVRESIVAKEAATVKMITVDERQFKELVTKIRLLRDEALELRKRHYFEKTKMLELFDAANVESGHILLAAIEDEIEDASEVEIDAVWSGFGSRDSWQRVH